MQFILNNANLQIQFSGMCRNQDLGRVRGLFNFQLTFNVNQISKIKNLLNPN